VRLPPVPVMKSVCFIHDIKAETPFAIHQNHFAIFGIATFGEASHSFLRHPIMIFRRQNRQSARFKKWRICLVLLAVATFIIILGINFSIVSGGNGRVFKQISGLPQRDFGLVMGTDLMRFDGSTNIHFLNRTEGAAEIFLSGKVKHLLISGNKSNKGFNEVSGIEGRLLAKGVPENAMTLDFDGTTTWKSARNAKEIYHLQKIIIITDAFHASRAIFLCRHFGIDAVAFCYGDEPVGFWSLRSNAREWLARVKAFFEVMFD
jgi:SanA protein